MDRSVKKVFCLGHWPHLLLHTCNYFYAISYVFIQKINVYAKGGSHWYPIPIATLVSV